VNWLIYYREKLFGKSIEQLAEEREEERKREENASAEVKKLPSEQNFQKLRLDELIVAKE
jgi:hypothetical protein